MNRNILLIILLNLSFLSAKEPTLVDKILVTVGNEIILKSELENTLTQIKKENSYLDSLSQTKKESIALSQIINQKIIYHIASQDTSLNISESKIDELMNQQMNVIANQVGSIKQFEEYLENQNVSLLEYKKALRKKIKTQVLLQSIQRKYINLDNIKLSAQQVRMFFKDNIKSLPILRDNTKLFFLEISIKPNINFQKLAFKKADSIIQLLNTGKDFKKLAQQFSDDPTGENGGDIGYIKIGDLDPFYERIAFRLELGNYSKKPVKTKFGYHIIKTTDKKNNEVRSSHILIKVPINSKDTLDGIKLLNNFKEKIEKGEYSFSEIAEKFSEDKNTKFKGGNLGWFSSQTIPEKYKEIVDTLKKGRVSSPIWINKKLCLLYIADKKKERKPSLKEDWEYLNLLAKDYYAKKKMLNKINLWRERIYIKNHSSIPIVKDNNIIF